MKKPWRKMGTLAAQGWHRWKEPWAWTAAGAAVGWFIAAHFGYLAWIALMVGNYDRVFMWGSMAVFFAVLIPVAMHHRPGRKTQSWETSRQEEEG